MRKETPAPVDTMGCDVFKDSKIEPRICRFHTLVSLMLSSQTKDEVNFTVMSRLKKRFENFSPEDVIECSEVELEELLKPVSFFKVSDSLGTSFTLLIPFFYRPKQNTSNKRAKC